MLQQFIPQSVSQDDKNMYSRVMSNWTYLSTYMCTNPPSIQTLGKLIFIELHGKKRKDILDRLVARLGTQVRQQLKQDLDALYERTHS